MRTVLSPSTEARFTALTREAFNLAVHVAYGTISPTGEPLDLRLAVLDPEVGDVALSWVEGDASDEFRHYLAHRARPEGRFDAVAYEKRVLKDIETLRGLLQRLGEPEVVSVDLNEQAA